MSEEKSKSHTGVIAGITAALSAGAVYFYGPEGDKHRRKFRGWILKTKGDVLERLEKAENVTKEKYEKIVDAAVEKFAEEKAKKQAEIEDLRQELKGHWEDIKQQAQEKGEELRAAAAEEIGKRGEELSEDIAPEDK